MSHIQLLDGSKVGSVDDVQILKQTIEQLKSVLVRQQIVHENFLLLTMAMMSFMKKKEFKTTPEFLQKMASSGLIIQADAEDEGKTLKFKLVEKPENKPQEELIEKNDGVESDSK